MECFAGRQAVIENNVRSVLASGFRDIGCLATGSIVEEPDCAGLTLNERLQQLRTAAPAKLARRRVYHRFGRGDFSASRGRAAVAHHAFVALSQSYHAGFGALLSFLQELPDSELLGLFSMDGHEFKHYGRAPPGDADYESNYSLCVFLCRRYVSSFSEGFTICVEAFNRAVPEGIRALEIIGLLREPVPVAPVTDARKTTSIYDRLRAQLAMPSPRHPFGTDMLRLPTMSYNFQLAYFLVSTPGLFPATVHSTCIEHMPAVLPAFVDLLDFGDLDLVDAFRFFTSCFLLSGESQHVYRAVETFARAYCVSRLRHAYPLAVARDEPLDLAALIELRKVPAGGIYRGTSAESTSSGLSAIQAWMRRSRPPKSEQPFTHKLPLMTRLINRTPCEVISPKDAERLEDTVLAAAYTLLMLHTSRRTKLMDLPTFRTLIRNAALVPLSALFVERMYQDVTGTPLECNIDVTVQYAPQHVNALRYLMPESSATAGAVTCYALKTDNRCVRVAIEVIATYLCVNAHLKSQLKTDYLTRPRRLDLTHKLLEVSLIDARRALELCPQVVNRALSLNSFAQHMRNNGYLVLQLVRLCWRGNDKFMKHSAFVIENYREQTTSVCRLIQDLQGIAEFNRAALRKTQHERRLAAATRYYMAEERARDDTYEPACVCTPHNRSKTTSESTKADYLSMLNALRYGRDMPEARSKLEALTNSQYVSCVPTAWHYMVWIMAMRERKRNDASFVTSEVTTDSLIRHVRRPASDVCLKVLSMADWDIQSQTPMGYLMLLPHGCGSMVGETRAKEFVVEQIILALSYGTVAVESPVGTYPEELAELRTRLEILTSGRMVIRVQSASPLRSRRRLSSQALGQSDPRILVRTAEPLLRRRRRSIQERLRQLKARRGPDRRRRKYSYGEQSTESASLSSSYCSSVTCDSSESELPEPMTLGVAPVALGGGEPAVVTAAKALDFLYRQNLMECPRQTDLYLMTWLTMTLSVDNPVEVRLLVTFFLVHAKRQPACCDLVPTVVPKAANTWQLLGVEWTPVIARWLECSFLCALPFSAIAQTWNALFAGESTYAYLVRKLLKARTHADSLATTHHTLSKHNLDPIFW